MIWFSLANFPALRKKTTKSSKSIETRNIYNRIPCSNFSEFPKVLRREPDKVLQYLSKEFAVPAERLGDKAMFVGRRAPDDFTRLFQIYVKDYVECPTCKSPDSKIVKENRISFLICEACGAKSTIKGKYA